ncbi:glycosyltransferase family 2 protein [Thalassotalea sp. PS06]|uniref:glycosyltransferase family 2 protein n=1 Tax=Thalassotalea sp. PS06 TaxID=2594005 RepID=UPI00163D40E5|nr:glycosyltransferase family 2 protein [Thalassotalea sp. PS06]
MLYTTLFHNFFSLRPKKLIAIITRCKDEYFVGEFVDYYRREGIDDIFIIDDDSNDKSIYENILKKESASVIFEKNIIEKNYASKLYKCLRRKYDWVLYIDVDEFIRTNSEKTIREILLEKFLHADCIKIPWVMMSSNGRDKSPVSILKANTWRWNHDKKHLHHIEKFRCRYEQIEVKCLFKTSVFKDIWDHHPKLPTSEPYIVDSIYGNKQELNPFHSRLRESDIKNGLLLCYHYRIISKENNRAKLKTNYWYKRNGYSLSDLESSDYAEVFDSSIANRNAAQLHL